MNSTYFYIFYSKQQRDVSAIYDACIDFLTEYRCLSELLAFSQIVGFPQRKQRDADKILSVEQGRGFIAANKLNGFRFRTKHRLGYDKEIDISMIPNNVERDLALGIEGGSILTVEKSLFKRLPSNWSALVERVASCSQINGAFQFDPEYERYQNTSNIAAYERIYGPVHQGFTTISRQLAINDAVSQVLDTSRNPGRFRSGGIAGLPYGKFKKVDSEMWLGPDFWPRAACSKEEVLAADFFVEKRDTPDFLYLRSWPHAFNRPDGEQGKMQQKLWRLLFNDDCEWPPGSGGIADSPVDD